MIARNGNYGVNMFFVISGFLITQHTLQRNGFLAQIKLKDFYIRRIARIMPCLVLLVAMVSVLGSLGLQTFSQSVAQWRRGVLCCDCSFSFEFLDESIDY